LGWIGRGLEFRHQAVGCQDETSPAFLAFILALEPREEPAEVRAATSPWLRAAEQLKQGLGTS
jgi:hypothetical protein